MRIKSESVKGSGLVSSSPDASIREAAASSANGPQSQSKKKDFLLKHQFIIYEVNRGCLKIVRAPKVEKQTQTNFADACVWVVGSSCTKHPTAPSNVLTFPSFRSPLMSRPGYCSSLGQEAPSTPTREEEKRLFRIHPVGRRRERIRTSSLFTEIRQHGLIC